MTRRRRENSSFHFIKKRWGGRERDGEGKENRDGKRERGSPPKYPEGYLESESTNIYI